MKHFFKRLTALVRKKGTLFYIGAIIILSLYPRLWMLSQKPPIIVDEAANLRMIHSILKNESLSPLEFHWDFSKTILTYYPSILLIKLFGNSNDLYFLRLTSLIYSLVALIPFFLLTRRLTNNVIAFAVTLLFGSSYYFLQFSRVGWVDIVFTTTLGLFLILFLQKAFEDKKSVRLIWIVVSGMTAGIIFYAYRGANVLISLSFLYLTFLQFTSHISFKKSFMTFILFFFTFLFVSLPWLIKISKNSDKYNLRANVVYIKNARLPYHGLSFKEDLTKYQILTSIKSWILLEGVIGGNEETPRYLPETFPPLNFFIRISFWAGAIISMLSYRNFKKTGFWLLIIITTIIFGQILTVHPPNGARALLMLPSYYIIAATFFNKIYEISAKNKIVLTIIILLSLFFSLQDFLFYQFWMEWIKV
ncbi:MAG: hypothetical protein UT24_C0002G0012 [Candidatus Woesebacteria bacterium GW2011_GWB1_39_12]|uniref:Uncharacterized protein n=2 Tax=Candidatus Woeseibacteriota TaxID=1752722 RepID=A0A0G0Q4P6_9BACT|nr:MAG: hypothetical protein UT23_C0028G0002 [Candidatus Woesebacteria bacterium GW2011_GWA1_39_12]KKR01749.1 MAG: hypothetical protein UT24_C0002G0012 [Candidatus Woesebacteria bacterium GW2011_GWB1_39_12]